MVNYADVGPDVKVTTSIVAGSMLFPTWNPIHPGLFLKIVAVTPCSLEVSWGQGTTASGTKLPRRWREQMMRPPKSLWLEEMLQFHGICQASWCPKTQNHMVVLMRESYLSTQGFFLPVITSSPHSRIPAHGQSARRFPGIKWGWGLGICTVTSLGWFFFGIRGPWSKGCWMITFLLSLRLNPLQSPRRCQRLRA